MDDANRQLGEVMERLKKIDANVSLLVQQRAQKEWLTTAEVAATLGRAPFTVREWCRHGRIKAEKRNSGRGPFAEWVISSEELKRYQKEGLLPLKPPS